ncbi:molybdopterin molybdotransferase MoeA [Ruminococcaceae bacterium OttesenSCG-928-I18]|nr:molybdopterin molybdotransferase MoeA [Ruminococcaceae bacterium OttesenSCG-928-I18]
MHQHLPLEKAVALLLEHNHASNASETLPLSQALGRVLAGDLFAQIAQPPFSRSPLDGYAVRYEDIANAGPSSPARLSVTQEIFAGDAPQKPLQEGEAARIMTGAPLPVGTSAVVRQEDTDEGGETVQIFETLGKGANLCLQGEDVQKGQPLLQGGSFLNSSAIGILAGQGLRQVSVYPKPKVGILSTGSELAELGAPLAEGKIYDSNLHLLCARVRELGGISKGVVAPDVPNTLLAELETLHAENDLVVSTGGVSVGRHDYMYEVGQKAEASPLFKGVAVKPGSPAIGFLKQGKTILCLSGNPFAAFATFEMLAVPCILQKGGNRHPLPQRSGGFLENDFHKPSPCRRLLRASLRDGKVYLPKKHASGMLSSLVNCNCLLDIPAGSGPLSRGDAVTVMLLR